MPRGEKGFTMNMPVTWKDEQFREIHRIPDATSQLSVAILYREGFVKIGKQEVPVEKYAYGFYLGESKGRMNFFDISHEERMNKLKNEAIDYINKLQGKETLHNKPLSIVAGNT